MKNLIRFIFCLALPTGLAAQTTETLTPSGDPEPIRAVKLIEAGGSKAQTERVFFGQVAALETVDLSFEVGGRMTMFDAQEGEFLEQGVQIAALDISSFERAIERAQLQLTQAERDLVRTQKLAQNNTVSATQAQNAETARDLAALTLREARDALEDAKLIAPFRALVASRLTPNFANVTPGQPIVRLHDMSEVRVEIDVPEQLFQQLSSVDGITFVGSSPLFENDIVLEPREFNAETQNIGQSYRVTLALPADRVTTSIIPGASMTVTARLNKTDARAVTLPPTAVRIQNDTAEVMVFTPNGSEDEGTVAWVAVDVTSNSGTDILVSGVSPDALIVAAGTQMLQEGQTVRPFTGLNVE